MLRKAIGVVLIVGLVMFVAKQPHTAANIVNSGFNVGMSFVSGVGEVLSSVASNVAGKK